MYLRVFVYGLIVSSPQQKNLRRNLRGYDGLMGRVGFEASVRLSLVGPFQHTNLNLI